LAAAANYMIKHGIAFFNWQPIFGCSSQFFFSVEPEIRVGNSKVQDFYMERTSLFKYLKI